MTEKSFSEKIWDATDDISTVIFKIRQLAPLFKDTVFPQLVSELTEWADSLSIAHDVIREATVEQESKMPKEKPKKKSRKDKSTEELFRELERINKELTENTACLTKLLLNRNFS